MKHRSIYLSLAILLLLVNSIGALYGGGSLMLHPNGSALKLPLYLLEHSPFNNFLIPGIVLFLCNGLFGVVVIIALLTQHRNATRLLVLQAIVLFMWIVIQVLFIRTIHFFHFIFVFVALAMFLCARRLK